MSLPLHPQSFSVSLLHPHLQHTIHSTSSSSAAPGISHLSFYAPLLPFSVSPGRNIKHPNAPVQSCFPNSSAPFHFVRNNVSLPYRVCSPPALTVTSLACDSSYSTTRLLLFSSDGADFLPNSHLPGTLDSYDMLGQNRSIWLPKVRYA